MIHGITMMLKLYADSLDLELQVNYLYVATSLSLHALTHCIYAGALAYTGSRYNPGSGPTHLYNVACLGSENSINECRKGNYGQASTSCRSHFRDASVLCPAGMKYILYALVIHNIYNYFQCVLMTCLSVPMERLMNRNLLV